MRWAKAWSRTSRRAGSRISHCGSRPSRRSSEPSSGPSRSPSANNSAPSAREPSRSHISRPRRTISPKPPRIRLAAMAGFQRPRGSATAPATAAARASPALVPPRRARRGAASSRRTALTVVGLRLNRRSRPGCCDVCWTVATVEAASPADRAIETPTAKSSVEPRPRSAAGGPLLAFATIDDMTISVTHFTDPGCPWAYSASPALAVLHWRYGEQLDWRLATIGLTEDAQQYVDRGYTPARGARGYLMFARRWGRPFA